MGMHFKPALNDTDLLSGSNEAVWGSYLGARASFQINTGTVGVLQQGRATADIGCGRTSGCGVSQSHGMV